MNSTYPGKGFVRCSDFVGIEILKQTVTLMALLIAGTSSVAWDQDNQANEPYDRYGNPSYRYRSTTGTEYQYDLSRPADQIRYEVDPTAQLLDSLNADPRRDIDQDLGQFSGGARRR